MDLAINRFVGLAILLLCTASAVDADERIRKALIIGNAEYSEIEPLQNSVNDAVLMLSLIHI